LDREVAGRTFQTFVLVARRGLFPDTYSCVFSVSSFFAMPDPKIAEPGGGKRVQGVCPDCLISKNCSFILEFTGRSLKTLHFSTVFGVFDPLDFKMDAKSAREPHIFSIVRFLLKNAFFKFGFLARSFLAASDPKIADSARGKRARGVRPDCLTRTTCIFIWEFIGRTPKNEHFSLVSCVFDLSGLYPASAADPRAPPPPRLHETAIFEEQRRIA